MRLAKTLLLSALVLFPAAASAAEPLAPADQAEVARVESYINNISTYKADFVQISPNGATSRGTLWISRPGRLRVEYRSPVKLRIFATPQWLIVEDCKVKEPQHLPLRSTPAGILIQGRVALSGDLSVLRVERESHWMTVTVAETKAPEKVQMRLVFRANPLQLAGWTVLDQNGAATRVTLENVQAGLPLDASLFGYTNKCEGEAAPFGR
jgi:outer membrane lipoprotein-sorting protein